MEKQFPTLKAMKDIEPGFRIALSSSQVGGLLLCGINFGVSAKDATDDGSLPSSFSDKRNTCKFTSQITRLFDIWGHEINPERAWPENSIMQTNLFTDQSISDQGIARDMKAAMHRLSRIINIMQPSGVILFTKAYSDTIERISNQLEIDEWNAIVGTSFKWSPLSYQTLKLRFADVHTSLAPIRFASMAHPRACIKNADKHDAKDIMHTWLFDVKNRWEMVNARHTANRSGNAVKSPGSNS